MTRQALKRHLARLGFEQLRRTVMPFATARGYLTDEDVFNRMSGGSSLTTSTAQRKRPRN
jgi:hypothetical protein